MIIPIRCFSCNKILASKFARYQELLSEMDLSKDKKKADKMDDMDDVETNKQTSEIFKILEIERYCCKRHLLSHVNLIQKI